MGARTEDLELYEFSLDLAEDLETELEELSNLGTKVVLDDVCLLGFLRASQNLSLNTTVRMAEPTVYRSSSKEL